MKATIYRPTNGRKWAIDKWVWVKALSAHNGFQGYSFTFSKSSFCCYCTVPMLFCCVCVCAIIGRVWSLQHSCRITIRRSLGVSRRRRLKELPLPPHLIVFLSSLPVGRSDDLHDNWERRRSTKAESVRKRGEARRRGGGGGGGRGRGIHHIRNSFPHT